MKTTVESLDDLKAERARLSNQVQLSRVAIRADLGLINNEIRPARRAIGFLGSFLKNKNAGLLGMGVNFATDHLLRRTILARANPAVRWFVPVLVRKLTGQLLTHEATTGAAERALGWVKEKTADPKPQPGTLRVISPATPKRAEESLTWRGLDVAEKMVRWVKHKTDAQPRAIEIVEEYRPVRRSAYPADLG